MFVPINGHDWKRYDDLMGNMTYREVLDLCNYVRTEYVVPMNHDFGDRIRNLNRLHRKMKIYFLE